MLGCDLYGIAHTEGISLAYARITGAAFALIGHKDCWLACFTYKVSKCSVKRKNAFARIINKETNIGIPNSGLGLCAHPCFELLSLRIFKSGGIHQDHIMTAKFRARLAHVTGYAWRVIDNGKFLASEAVKDCGFADIGPSDNRYFRRALFGLFGLRRLYRLYIVIIYIVIRGLGHNGSRPQYAFSAARSI